MRKMSKEDRKIIENEITQMMQNAVSSDYARYILESKGYDDDRHFMDAVIDDVMDSSAWHDEGYYNDDDIRLAIGRVMMERMEIFY